MKNLIANKWTDSSNSKTIDVFDPVLNKLIDTIPASTLDDVDECIKESYDAFKEWNLTHLNNRCEVIYRFKELVKMEESSLSLLLSSETGKTIRECKNEIKELINICTSCIESAKSIKGEYINNDNNEISIMTYEPLGITLVVLSSTMPALMFAKKVLPSIIMGNTVIAKPSSTSPLTVTKLAFLLRKAGAPSGVIEIIHGHGPIVGQALCANKRINLINLCGTVATGQEVVATSSRNLVRTVLELKENNIFILNRDGNVDKAVRDLVNAKISHAGETCDSPRRIFIHNRVKDDFINKLTERIKTIRIADPKDEATDLGSQISEETAIGIENKIKELVSNGSTLLYGGNRNNTFIEPTIITNIKTDSKVMKDEIIDGPVFLISTFDDIDDVVEIANSGKYDYVSYIYTEDMHLIYKLTRDLNCNNIVVNDSKTNTSIEPLKVVSYYKTTTIRNLMK